MANLPQAVPIEVQRGHYTKPDALSAPLAGFRHGNILYYDLELPEKFVPAEGKTRQERIFVLLDVGISFSNPIWFKGDEIDTWYANLVHIEKQGNRYICLDFFIDAIIPTDGRPYRQLDIEEFAQAIDANEIPWQVASLGLQRWQTFLDTYLHQERFPTLPWSDFPPQAIRALQTLPSTIMS